jgi:signal peptidase I
VSFHPLSRLPAPWRRIVDWVITLAVAIGFVLAFEAEVAKPFRIPSASMEHTLHCARAAAGCRSSISDRVLVNRLAYVFGGPQRDRSSSSRLQSGRAAAQPRTPERRSSSG